jgi:hypothetical protein
MNFKTPVGISLPLLKEFVYEAKLRTFASTDVKTTLSDQTSVYSYRPFNDPRFAGMIYVDMYSGNTIEGGQESVTIDLVLRWRNQYYGGMKMEFWDLTKNAYAVEKFDSDLVATGPRFPEVVGRFHKQALLNMPREFPVRGPHEFRINEVEFEGVRLRGEWEYTNSWKSVRLFDIEDPFVSFVGEERILVNGIEVFWHAYHGGLVHDKYFPAVVQRT